MNVFFSDEQDQPVDGAGLVSLAHSVLEAERLPAETEMSLILIPSDQMDAYNRRFMGREGPTDVLAFPLDDLVAGHPPQRIANEPPVALGDVFLCPAEITRRLAEGEVAPGFDYSLERLMVHGILHLLGYDHETEAAGDRMEDREDELLAAAKETPR